ncbi:MAG: DUF2279 domain-containing protein [Burkholderiaceae bacterium]
MLDSLEKAPRTARLAMSGISLVLMACFHCAGAQTLHAGLHFPEAYPAQLSANSAPSAASSSASSLEAPPQLHLPDERQVHLRTWGIILGSSAAVGLYGQQKWWQDGFDSRFKQENEGWFGRNTYSGGADKLGHFFMAYAGTRLSSSAFEWAGNAPEDSLRLAALTTLGILSGVEILDGFSRNWNFSKEDAIVNALGTGAGILMEKNPELDRLLDIRLLYWPSKESGREFNPFGDYSGQTYLLVAKASGVPALREHPVLRYLEVAIGYGTRGYSDSPRKESIDPERNVYVGLSLNLSEVLRDTVFHSRQSRTTQRATETFLEFVQVPGTAGLVRQQLSGN